jgi:hypothetical protein
MITFPEAAQYLQKDDITERQGDPVKRRPYSFREGKRTNQLDFKLRGLA